MLLLGWRKGLILSRGVTSLKDVVGGTLSVGYDCKCSGRGLVVYFVGGSFSSLELYMVL